MNFEIYLDIDLKKEYFALKMSDYHSFWLLYDYNIVFLSFVLKLGWI